MNSNLYLWGSLSNTGLNQSGAVFLGSHLQHRLTDAVNEKPKKRHPIGSNRYLQLLFWDFSGFCLEQSVVNLLLRFFDLDVKFVSLFEVFHHSSCPVDPQFFIETMFL